jgi:hypothetical protein
MDYRSLFYRGTFFLLFGLIVFSSCKCKQPAATVETKAEAVPAVGTENITAVQEPAVKPPSDSVIKVAAVPENYRLVISFISIGSGINSAAKEKLENYLQLNETLKMKNPQIERTRWGREGEVDYCMKLSAFTVAEQEKIVKGIKEQLKNQDHIFINENAPCRHKRPGGK